MNESEFIEAGRKWLANDRKKKSERHKENNEEWRNDNPDYDKMYYQLHQEHYIEKAKKWRENNPEHKREYLKTERGKATVQRSHYKRKANEGNAINTLTADEWLDILKKYDYKCAYCGKDLSNLLAQRDHIIPVSKGGGNTKENIVPSCRSCNSKKGGRLL